jgi:hypothetical protein
MAQPKPVLPSQPRLRSLARLEAEIVKAEAERCRWAVRAESLRARDLDNRAELALAQIAEARLARLNRSRTVLLEGDAGNDDEPEAD